MAPGTGSAAEVWVTRPSTPWEGENCKICTGVLPALLGRQGEGIWFPSTCTKLLGMHKPGINFCLANFGSRKSLFPSGQNNRLSAVAKLISGGGAHSPACRPCRCGGSGVSRLDPNHWPAGAQPQWNRLGGHRAQRPPSPPTPRARGLGSHHSPQGRGEAGGPGAAGSDDVVVVHRFISYKKKLVSLGSFCNKVI